MNAFTATFTIFDQVSANPVAAATYTLTVDTTAGAEVATLDGMTADGMDAGTQFAHLDPSKWAGATGREVAAELGRRLAQAGNAGELVDLNAGVGAFEAQQADPIVAQLVARAIAGETRAAREVITLDTLYPAIDAARALLAADNVTAAARLSDWIDSDSEELGEEAEDAAYALAAEITGY